MLKLNAEGKSCLIGHSGFIGGHLQRTIRFDDSYNSRTIAEIKGREYDVIVCAGLPGFMWRANAEPQTDFGNVQSLIGCLGKARAKQIVHISTVEVYSRFDGVDETTPLRTSPANAYGRHRLQFEQYLLENFPDVRIVRLPVVYGDGQRKNLIYDLLNNRRTECINPAGTRQYYRVDKLAEDIAAIMNSDIRTVNLVSEPVRTSEIAGLFFPAARIGSVAAPETHYDVRSIHAGKFGASNRYMRTRHEVLADIGSMYLGSGLAL